MIKYSIGFFVSFVALLIYAAVTDLDIRYDWPLWAYRSFCVFWGASFIAIVLYWTGLMAWFRQKFFGKKKSKK